MAELYDAPVGLIIQANQQGFQYTASNYGMTGPYPAGMTYGPDYRLTRLKAQT